MRDENKEYKHIHIPKWPKVKGMGDMKVRVLGVGVVLGQLREGVDFSGGGGQGGPRARQQTELCTRKS